MLALASNRQQTGVTYPRQKKGWMMVPLDTVSNLQGVGIGVVGAILMIVVIGIIGSVFGEHDG